MANSTTSAAAKREAVQPSLWDRLVDDLPGLVSEIRQRQAVLAANLGADRLELLAAGGVRAVEQENDLTDQQRRDVFGYLTQLDRQRFLEERGVVVTPDVLREAVRRDMEKLFGIERLQSRIMLSETERGDIEDPEDLIAEFAHVRRSVLNYGVPTFSGRRANDFDVDALARELHEVIAVFEPRLKRDTIKVDIESGDSAGLKIKIEGILLLSPAPERLRLSTTINLDSGKAVTAIEDP